MRTNARSLAVGSGALLWICSVLIVGILAYLLIIKAVNHPGREAWARSVGSLTGPKKKAKPQATTTYTKPGNRDSIRETVIIVEDPFAEPEALRPFLNMDLVDDDDSSSQHHSSITPSSSPSRTAQYYVSSSSNPYSASSSQSPHSRSYHSLHTQRSSHHGGRERASSSPHRNRDRASTMSHHSHRTSTPSHSYPSPQGHPLALTATHSRSYSQQSLTSLSHYDSAAVPPVPPLPKVIVDEKRRDRQPQAIMDEKRRERTPLPQAPRSAKGKGRVPLRIQPPKPGDMDKDEGAIVSAASDVFSVMADFAGSPRSPRTMFNEYPPMAIPVKPSGLAPSREATPRPFMPAENWSQTDNAPPYTPPLTSASQWSVTSSNRPLPSVDSSAGLYDTSPWDAPRTSPPNRPGYDRMPSSASTASGFPFPPTALDRRPSAQTSDPLDVAHMPYRPSTAPPPAKPPALGSSGVPLPRSGTVPPEQQEATLFFNGPPMPPMPPRATSADSDEATLFFNGPRAQPPAVTPTHVSNPPISRAAAPLGEEEATLFFNAPAIRRPPKAVTPDREEQEATLFFGRPPLPTPPVVQPVQGEEEEATLFFPSRRG